jgi:S-adenosylmethionine:tRNA ribosyltransferase-isomerase
MLTKLQMKLTDFDYHLPDELIAQTPIEPRDSSRLMVLGEGISHRHFFDITDYFENGDTLVLNQSKVVPAKLIGHKSTGGRVEALVVSKNGAGYECLVQGKHIREGTKLHFGELEAEVLEVRKNTGTGKYLLDFKCSGNLEDILEKIGEAPLPPYIKEKLDDKNRYQTVYSKEKGSIAAPTAGLHFTEELLGRIRDKGVNIAYVTLHVGIGTFMPVKTDEIEQHIMEPEFYSITEENAKRINETQGKTIVCGTTTVKALESSCVDGKIMPAQTSSTLFIHPPYKFKSGIDAIITNFHLPKSTLLMLISAFAGKERIASAYNEAIANSYRFYSFGDAMLIFR